MFPVHVRACAHTPFFVICPLVFVWICGIFVAGSVVSCVFVCFGLGQGAPQIFDEQPLFTCLRRNVHCGSGGVLICCMPRSYEVMDAAITHFSRTDFTMNGNNCLPHGADVETRVVVKAVAWFVSRKLS